MEKNVAYWFAVHTRSRHEKQVDSFLREKNISSFLPLVKTISRRRDRKKFIDVPLFPGYLFVNITLDNLYEIKSTRGVVRIIGDGEGFIPSPIPDAEINNLKTLINSNVAIDPYKYLQKGTKVRVVSGPLIGLEGLLVKRKTNYRVVVSIDILQKSTSAEISIADIESID
ncbi:UpxY family transcription antiterminator [Candidatus Kuenenia sp.]|uniref:UpxY family transcription antiterminator n=1 Tax=Candidatus Kuenenia sp. TaxID=2499824 RepID=UPI0032208DB3